MINAADGRNTDHTPFTVFYTVFYNIIGLSGYLLIPVFQPIFPDLVCQFFTVCLHMDAVLVPVVKYKSDPLT